MKRLLCICLIFSLLTGGLPTIVIQAEAAFTTAPMVATGSMHTLALSSSGTVYAWGSNDRARLGIGIAIGFGEGDQPDIRTSPQRVPNLSNIVQVAVGAGHSVALRSDGTVWTWGDNFFGQLGSGSFDGLFAAGNPAPARVPNLNNITAISTMEHHTLALRSDGTVWAWGNGGLGQLGIGSYYIDNLNFDNPHLAHRPFPVQVDYLTNIIDISAGAYHSAAVRADGTVWTWGANETGQLGIGTVSRFVGSPVQVRGITDAASVSAGGVFMPFTDYTFRGHTLAIRENGTVLAWGANCAGQLGLPIIGRDNPFGHVLTPTPIHPDPPTFVSVSAGRNRQTTGICTMGVAWSWGSNNTGALGQNTDLHAVATPQSVITVAAIDGEQYRLGFSAVYISGTAAVLPDGTVRVWGRNNLGQAGIGETTPSPGVGFIPLLGIYADRVGYLNSAVPVIGVGGVGHLNLGATAPIVPGRPGGMPFVDLVGWAYVNHLVYIEFVYIHGIMSGITPTTFGPTETITREEFVASLFHIYHGRSANENDPRLSPFSDVETDSPFAPYITWAYIAGIDTHLQNRTDTHFNGYRNITGRDAAVLMHSYINELTDLDAPFTRHPAWDTFSGHQWISQAQYNALDWALGVGIIPVINNSFNLNASISRAGVAGVLYHFAGILEGRAPTPTHVAQQQPGEDVSIPFTDVNSSHWFYQYVRAMYVGNIMQGTSETAFSPQGNFSRAQIVATLFRIYHGRPANAADQRDNPFPDMPADFWASPYAAWARSAGVITRTGNFAPNQNVSRQEIALLMHNYITRLTNLDNTSTATPQWNALTDTGQLGEYYDSLRWANAGNIIRGQTATTIAPTSFATRAEAAAMLDRFIDFLNNALPPRPGQAQQGQFVPVTLPNRRLTQDELENWLMHYHHQGGISDAEREMLRQMNIERARVGASELTLCPVLSAAARFKAQEMVDLNYFAHQSPVYGAPFVIPEQLFGATHFISENLHRRVDTPDVIRNIVTGMQAQSPPHWDNMTDPTHVTVGIGIIKARGVAVGHDGTPIQDTYGIMVAVMFGS